MSEEITLKGLMPSEFYVNEKGKIFRGDNK